MKPDEVNGLSLMIGKVMFPNTFLKFRNQKVAKVLWDSNLYLNSNIEEFAILILF